MVKRKKRTKSKISGILKLTKTQAKERGLRPGFYVAFKSMKINKQLGLKLRLGKRFLKENLASKYVRKKLTK